VRELERFWPGDGRSWTGEDEIDASRLEPVAVFVEVGVDAGDAAEFAAAPGEEAGAVGVAVDRGAIGEFVFSGD